MRNRGQKSNFSASISLAKMNNTIVLPNKRKEQVKRNIKLKI
jgi:hypothetical protein